MDQTCPLDFKLIDATTVRIISLFVMLLSVVMIWSGSLLIAVASLVDLTIRLYFNPNYSPLMQLALRTQSLLGLAPRFEDAAAKRLAAHFTLAFMLLFVLLIAQQQWLWLYGVAALFFTCSALEVFFGYCIGCKIYRFYLFVKKVQ